MAKAKSVLEISIAEVTPGVNMEELFKIVGAYKGMFKISLGIETPKSKFKGSPEEGVFHALNWNKKRIGYGTEVHLNGECNNFWQPEQPNINLQSTDKVIFNLNTIKPDLQWLAELGAWIERPQTAMGTKFTYTFNYKHVTFYMLNYADSNAILGQAKEAGQPIMNSLMDRGRVKMLNFPGVFSHSGWNPNMPLFGKRNDNGFCGGIDHTNFQAAADSADEILKISKIRKNYPAKRWLVGRGALLENGQLNLTHVGDFFEQAAMYIASSNSRG